MGYWLEVGILVAFDYSLLLVTQLAGIRYLVFVTLLVTGLSSLQRCSAAVVGPIPGTLQAVGLQRTGYRAYYGALQRLEDNPVVTVHTSHLGVAKPIV